MKPRRPPKEGENEKCGGRGKKERNFGRSGGGEGVQHNGGSCTGWSWARGVPRREVHGPKNKNMSNKLSRGGAPLANVFWVKYGSQRFGHKGFIKKKRGQESVWAKRRSGPKGGLGQCGPKVVRKTKKHGKNQSKINSPLHPKQKTEKTNRKKKSPKSKKMEKYLSSSLPDQKNQKKIQKTTTKSKNSKKC